MDETNVLRPGGWGAVQEAEVQVHAESGPVGPDGSRIHRLVFVYLFIFLIIYSFIYSVPPTPQSGFWLQIPNWQLSIL